MKNFYNLTNLKSKLSCIALIFFLLGLGAIRLTANPEYSRVSSSEGLSGTSVQNGFNEEEKSNNNKLHLSKGVLLELLFDERKLKKRMSFLQILRKEKAKRYNVLFLNVIVFLYPPKQFSKVNNLMK